MRGISIKAYFLLIVGGVLVLDNSVVPSFLVLTEAYWIATGRVWYCCCCFFFLSVFSVLFSSTRAQPVFGQKYDPFSLLGKLMDIVPRNCTVLERFPQCKQFRPNPILFCMMYIVYRTRCVLDFRSPFHEISCTCFGHLLLHMQIKNIVEIL